MIVGAALLLVLVSEGAADTTTTRPYACVPMAELRLARFDFRDNAMRVHRRFRKPLATRTYKGEDDGGEFNYQEETFDGIVFTFGRDQSLDRIEVTSPKYGLPSGVRVGMQMAAVAKALHFSTSGVSPTATVRLTPCDSFEDAQLELTFSIDTPESPFGRSLLTRVEVWVAYD